MQVQQSRNEKGTSYELIEDQAYEDMIDHIRVKRAGRAKREEVRNRREQNRAYLREARV